MSGLVQLTGSCSGSESHILSCNSAPTVIAEGERLTGFIEVTGSTEQCRPGLDEVAIQCGKPSLHTVTQDSGTPL